MKSIVLMTLGVALAGCTVNTTRTCALPTDEAALRALGAQRKAEIVAAPDLVVKTGAEVRYVSDKGSDTADGRTPQTAWRTTARANAEKLPPGAYVLYARGGLYRGTVQAQPGVTYGAYGTGPKPRIYGSPENGANPAKWQKTDAKNIWAYSIGPNDVGTLVFDEGEQHAIKIVIRTDAKTGKKYNKFTGRPFTSYRDLDTDLHFWHDYYKGGTGKVYLYSVTNPGQRFKSIEFNVKTSGFSVGGRPNVTIDNFAIKYVGIHGVAASTCTNLTVSNCTFDWIGGSIQAEGIFGRDHPTRFGNGVEIYGGCLNYLVTNCWFDQVYDAGVTHQFNIPEKAGLARYDQRHVRYVDNVFRRCNYAIEYFLTAHNGNMSLMEDVLFERNLMFDTGYGFCEQRPDLEQAAAIKAWYRGDRNRARNYRIHNNAICRSKDMLVQICSALKNADGSTSMPVMTDNVIIGSQGDLFGNITETTDKRLPYTPDIQQLLDSRGAGNKALFQ